MSTLGPRLLASFLLVCLALAGGCSRRSGRESPAGGLLPRVMSAAQYEAWARKEFARRHPHEKPLNWSIAEAARRFYTTKPMGRFVLALKVGQWGNDCSDFADCCVDEGLGVKARFRRGSRAHLLAPVPELWQCFYWKPGFAVQPGDTVCVTHSPHYAPHPGACGHVGVVGPDGMVYDFAKLKRWKSARYGRNSFEWFTHNCGNREVVIARIAPQYRYRIEPLPVPLP